MEAYCFLSLKCLGMWPTCRVGQALQSLFDFWPNFTSSYYLWSHCLKLFQFWLECGNGGWLAGHQANMDPSIEPIYWWGRKYGPKSSPQGQTEKDVLPTLSCLVLTRLDCQGKWAISRITPASKRVGPYLNYRVGFGYELHCSPHHNEP